jgi:DUF1365 family protein
MCKRQQMPTGRRPGDARSLRRQCGVQSLAVRVKALQHRHAFGHTFNEICFFYCQDQPQTAR